MIIKFYYRRRNVISITTNQGKGNKYYAINSGVINNKKDLLWTIIKQFKNECGLRKILQIK